MEIDKNNDKQQNDNWIRDFRIQWKVVQHNLLTKKGAVVGGKKRPRRRRTNFRIIAEGLK